MGEHRIYIQLYIIFIRNLKAKNTVVTRENYGRNKYARAKI